MLTFYNKYKGGEYSQNGEAGIIDEVLKRIKISVAATAIEFGAPTMQYCSNIYHLMKRGWYCIYYDNDPKEKGINRLEITPSNINTLPPCDIISLDTDGNDLAIWESYTGKPDIVIIEINSSLPPMTDHFTIDKGASYISMLKLGISKGYFLLCHTGNLIFVLDKHRKLFPEIKGDGIENYSDYFNTSWL